MAHVLFDFHGKKGKIGKIDATGSVFSRGLSVLAGLHFKVLKQMASSFGGHCHANDAAIGQSSWICDFFL